MAERYLSHAERCRRVEATLESKGWTWYKLAQEMGVDQMRVHRNFDISYKKKHGFCVDPRLSLIRCLARATGTSMGFWMDREVR